MSVMCAGKHSVTAHIFWDTEESTLERSPMSVTCVGKLSGGAHTSLYISGSTLERSPGDCSLARIPESTGMWGIL